MRCYFLHLNNFIQTKIRIIGNQMGDFSQVFLQLYHIKQHISSIVDDNTATIETNFAKSQADPQNVECT